MFAIETVQVDSIQGREGEGYITDVLQELTKRVCTIIDDDKEHDASSYHSVQLLVTYSPDKRFIYVGMGTIHRLPKPAEEGS